VATDAAYQPNFYSLNLQGDPTTKPQAAIIFVIIQVVLVTD
jgi:hypothetical protein